MQTKISVNTQVININSIEIRDWERGVGPTLSSGTGAAAAVVVSVIRGLTQRNVRVKTQAGMILVRWHKTSNQVSIKGPVEYIGSGEFHC